jgi:hypothetical protein
MKIDTIGFLASLSLLSPLSVVEGADEADLSLRGSQKNRQLVLAGYLTKLELIDSTSDTKVLDLINGQVIATSRPSFNVNAAYSDPTQVIKSVKFTNAQQNRTENSAAYAFCGNNGADFYNCTTLGYGTHTITAVPYSASNGLGEAGTAVTVTFSIVSPATSPTTLAPVAAPKPTLPPVAAAPVSTIPNNCKIPKKVRS